MKRSLFFVFIFIFSSISIYANDEKESLNDGESKEKNSGGININIINNNTNTNTNANAITTIAYRPFSFFLGNPDFIFTKSQINFLSKYYFKWGFSPEDQGRNYVKYRQLLKTARTIIVVGVVLSFLGLGAGFFIIPFCAIPFWQASMVKHIFKKITGFELALDVSDNIINKFVINDFVNNVNNNGKKLELSISLVL